MLVGLSMDASANFRRFPRGKNALMFEALNRRYGVEAVHHPALSPPDRKLRQLRAFHPDQNTWRRRFNLDPRTFEARTVRAKAMLEGSAANVLVLLHTLVAPPSDRPYVHHMDTTYRLTERFFPEGAPLRGSARARWLEQETEVYRGASALFPRSTWVARSLIDEYGCEPDRVLAVGCGANLPILTLERRRWDSQTALFVGLEWGRKGGPTLLRAWERVVAACPRARLQVIGIPRRPRKLPPGVEWLGEIRDRDRMAALFANASVFVMPSNYEPWGNVFLEAMASGLPCVGANVCAMPEIIRHGQTGLLVPRRDHGALAQALIELLDDPAAAETMGRAGHDIVSTRWNWDAVVDRMAPYIEHARDSVSAYRATEAR